MSRILVSDAARILGISQVALQNGLIHNAFLFGSAWMNENSTCWNYYVSRERLLEYLQSPQLIQCKNIQTEKAARMLGISVLGLRNALKQNKMPFGTTWTNSGSTHTFYYINSHLFEKYVVS